MNYSRRQFAPAQCTIVFMAFNNNEASNSNTKYTITRLRFAKNSDTRLRLRKPFTNNNGYLVSKAVSKDRHIS